MKYKKNKIFCLLICIVFCIQNVFCGCEKQYEDLTKTAKANILSGTPSINITEEKTEINCNRNESAEILFEKGGLSANEFYEVSAIITADDKQYSAIGGGNNDINGKSVVDKAEKDKTEVSRIVRSDNNGVCSFKIFAGNSRENTKGSVTIRKVHIKPAEETEKYRIYKSTDSTVRIIFNKDDVQHSGADDKEIIKWLDIMSEFRKEADKISVYGLDRIDFCATEEFSHYGLSGNPIYICKTYVKDDLRKISETIDENQENRDILWRYIHEMSHAADGFGYGEIAPRVFDSEFSAQLECAYLMTKLRYRYDGEKTASEYFSSSIPLEKMIFSDEGFLYRLVSIAEKTDTELKSIEKAILSSKYRSEMSDFEKLEIFFDEISEYLGFDVRTGFSEKELEVINRKYQ